VPERYQQQTSKLTVESLIFTETSCLIELEEIYREGS